MTQLTPFEVYRNIVSRITDADERRVADIMLGHIGKENMILPGDLAVEAFGKYNTYTDRTARLILCVLVIKYGMAVCSLSGKAGRWLAKDEVEREKSASELDRRGDNDHDRARALRRASVPPPATPPIMERAVQAALW